MLNSYHRSVVKIMICLCLIFFGLLKVNGSSIRSEAADSERLSYATPSLYYLNTIYASDTLYAYCEI